MSSARAPCVIVILLAFGSLCGAVTPSPPPTVNATEVPATSQPQDAAASGSGSGSGDYKVKPVWMVVFGLAVGITAIAAVQWIRRREHATKQRISEGMKAALNNEHTRQQNGGQDLLVAKSFSAVSPTASSEAALTPLRPKDSPILLPRQPRSTSDSGAAGLSPASPGVESGVLSPLGDPNSGANRSQPLVPGSPASTASNEATSLSSSFDSKRASSGGRLSKRLKTHLDAEHILSRVNSNNSQLTSPHLSPKSECSATPSSTRRRRLVGKRLPTLVKQDVDANYTVRSREEVLRIITELDGTEPSPPGSGEQSPEDALRLRSQQSATSASSLHPSNHPSSTAQRMRELN